MLGHELDLEIQAPNSLAHGDKLMHPALSVIHPTSAPPPPSATATIGLKLWQDNYAEGVEELEVIFEQLWKDKYTSVFANGSSQVVDGKG